MRAKVVVPLGAVLCACACLVGCGREDALPPALPAEKPAQAVKDVSRAHDAEYQKQLKGYVAVERQVQAGRAGIEAKMAQLRERAKKALPAGATDEQIEAELVNNPRKYPAWNELCAALKSIGEEVERNRAAAQTAVRRRVLREVAERAQGASSAAK